MFEKLKAKRIVKNTLTDARCFMNELPKHDIYLSGGFDDLLIASFFIAFCDFYAYIHKRIDLGDLIVKAFLEKVKFVDLTHSLLIDTHKDYHQIIKDCLQLDSSPDGLYKGYLAISRYIGAKLLIDSSKIDVIVLIDSILCQRMNEINKAIG